jgi:hypothetical protein
LLIINRSYTSLFIEEEGWTLYTTEFRANSANLANNRSTKLGTLIYSAHARAVWPMGADYPDRGLSSLRAGPSVRSIWCQTLSNETLNCWKGSGLLQFIVSLMLSGGFHCTLLGTVLRVACAARVIAADPSPAGRPIARAFGSGRRREHARHASIPYNTCVACASSALHTKDLPEKGSLFRPGLWCPDKAALCDHNGR